MDTCTYVRLRWFLPARVSGSHLFGVGLAGGVQDYEIFWEMTSGISCSILYQCLVRQRILFLRQSTELCEDAHTISTCRWTVGDDFGIVSVFSAKLGSTADICTASVYGAF